MTVPISRTSPPGGGVHVPLSEATASHVRPAALSDPAARPDGPPTHPAGPRIHGVCRHG